MSRGLGTGAVALLLIATLGVSLAVGQATPLGRPMRVGCQMGKPPFSDAHARDINATLCDGLFADLFYLAMQRMGQTYTMTMIDDDNIGPYLAVDNATNTSQFDMFVAFQTITPERLSVMDFSLSMYQTQYRMGLAPRFHSSAAGLESAVVRASVWYLLAVVSTMALVAGIIYWIFESLEPESELMKMPRWRRGLTCAEAGFETTMSGSTSLALSHQLSRSSRAIFAIMSMFVVAIFGAVITSQLTADSASSREATLADARGERVAHALPVLHTWLQSELGTRVEENRDIETFADDFYAGKLPSFAGYVAESDVVAFLHNLHGGADNGYTVSLEFTHHGSVDLKAFPFSKLLPTNVREAFNVQLELMREDGELATLINREVSKFSYPVAEDITVPKDAFIAIRAVAITMYCVFFAIALGFFVIDKLTARPPAEEANGDEEAGDARPTKGAATPGGGSITSVTPSNGFIWRGKMYEQAPPEVLRVLDAMAAFKEETTKDAQLPSPRVVA